MLLLVFTSTVTRNVCCPFRSSSHTLRFSAGFYAAASSCAQLLLCREPCHFRATCRVRGGLALVVLRTSQRAELGIVKRWAESGGRLSDVRENQSGLCTPRPIYSEHIWALSGFNWGKLKQDGGNHVRLIQDLLQAHCLALRITSFCVVTRFWRSRWSVDHGVRGCCN